MRKQANIEDKKNNKTIIYEKIELKFELGFKVEVKEILYFKDG
jgi:hypothetical protein